MRKARVVHEAHARQFAPLGSDPTLADEEGHKGVGSLSLERRKPGQPIPDRSQGVPAESHPGLRLRSPSDSLRHVQFEPEKPIGGEA